MIKISRGMRARRAGLLNDLLVRAGLRTPAPAGPNIGASVARGLGYGALAAPLAAYGGARAYGLSDEQIGSAIGDTALGLMGGVGVADDPSMSLSAKLGRDEAYFGQTGTPGSALSVQGPAEAPVGSAAQALREDAAYFGGGRDALGATDIYPGVQNNPTMFGGVQGPMQPGVPIDPNLYPNEKLFK